METDPNAVRAALASLRLPAACLQGQAADLSEVQPTIERLHARFAWSRSGGRRRPAAAVRVHAAQCGPLALSMLAYGGRFDIRPEHLGRALLATTVLDGRLAQHTRAGSWAGEAGDTVLAADADGASFGYEERTEVLKLRLPQARIDALCWQSLGHAGAAPVRFASDALRGPAALGWLSLLGYLVQSVQAGTAFLGDRLEECFILHLLQTVPHNYSDALRRDDERMPSTRAHGRARAYIEAHWQEPLTLADIAGAAGCSIRSLTRAFRLGGGISPMQYLQELRLQRVREALQEQGGPAETVADIAMCCGFGHLGEFNRQYRRRFGEPPSAARRGA